MNVYCTECEDQFHPVEGMEQPVGAEEPRFCSDECEAAYWNREEFTALYWGGRVQAAPVFPGGAREGSA